MVGRIAKVGHIAKAAAWVIIILLLAPAGGAAVIVDQEHFTPSSDLIAFIGEGFPYVAQTVTPLGSGTIPRVDLWVDTLDSQAGNWTFSIRSVNAAGAPTGTILATQTLTAAQVHPNDSDFTNPTVVNFTTPAAVTPGVPFAIVVSTDPPMYGSAKGYWRGTTSRSGVPYNGGASFYSLDGVTFTEDISTDDLLFRTYVDGVMTPEPAAILPAALVLLVSRRRRCERTTGTSDESFRSRHA
jgi:hypothetical protein